MVAWVYTVYTAFGMVEFGIVYVYNIRGLGIYTVYTTCNMVGWAYI